MHPIPIDIVVLPHAADLDLPTYATAGAACFDLVAAVAEPVPIYPGKRYAVPTGLRMAVPGGWEMQVRARSGLSLSKGIILANGIGTIDEDYRGEVKVILLNTDPHEAFHVTRGMRIAQATLKPVHRVAWAVRQDLPDTARGQGGFGSTGA